uniref:DSBA-like thioredoxin domain-containing protein n=1 Tax=Sinocyclocheilus anshuiensis TaxID=1608454 RepID=A0A671MK46_9TELE
MFSSGKVVELFYDVVSPYSWLAFEVLCRYRNVWNIDLKFKPAYLTGVIYGSGNQPAGMNPSKLTYIVSDLTLLSEYFGVPMFRPSDLSDKGIQLQACFYGGRESSTRCSLYRWFHEEPLTSMETIPLHKRFFILF